jgi:hypothetical protein
MLPTTTPSDRRIDRSAKKQRLRPLIARLTIACLPLITTFGAYAQSSASTPQATLTAFYHWYLAELAKNKDPYTDNRSKLEAYVSKGLLREIDQKSKTEDGLESDPFTQAQDEFKDWPTNIAVTNVQIKGGTASAVVTLGATEESRFRLALKLIKEGDGWKISKVSGP